MLQDSGLTWLIELELFLYSGRTFKLRKRGPAYCLNKDDFLAKFATSAINFELLLETSLHEI